MYTGMVLFLGMLIPLGYEYRSQQCIGSQTSHNLEFRSQMNEWMNEWIYSHKNYEVTNLYAGKTINICTRLEHTNSDVGKIDAKVSIAK